MRALLAILTVAACRHFTTPDEYAAEERAAAARQQQSARHAKANEHRDEIEACRALNAGNETAQAACERERPPPVDAWVFTPGNYDDQPPRAIPVPDDAAVDAAIDAPVDAADPRDSQPWWCVGTGPGRALAYCDRTRDACDAYAANTFGVCAWQPHAACFSFFVILDKKKIEACAPSFGDCKGTRSLMLSKGRDDYRVLSDCVAK